MNLLRLFFKEEQICADVEEYSEKMTKAQPGDILLFDEVKGKMTQRIYNKTTGQKLIERIIAKIVMLIVAGILLIATLILFKIVPPDNIKVLYVLCLQALLGVAILYLLK